MCVYEVSGECECASGEWSVSASVLHHGLRVYNNNTVHACTHMCISCVLRTMCIYKYCSRRAMSAGNLNIYTLGNFGSSCTSYNCILTINIILLCMWD